MKEAAIKDGIAFLFFEKYFATKTDPIGTDKIPILMLTPKTLNLFLKDIIFRFFVKGIFFNFLENLFSIILMIFFPKKKNKIDPNDAPKLEDIAIMNRDTSPSITAIDGVIKSLRALRQKIPNISQS
ncbi:MAG: hypothetical protein P8Q42_01625 [Flavobacteriales bacterium]|nr:hypothetical protein [Flavobacteriales bacterium]